jgi:AraC-like DNA-binding protein
MRTFGRKCRGKRKVYLHLVRETEKKLLAIGSKVMPLALYAQMQLSQDPHIEAAQHERLMQTLDQALEAHRYIEKQSRQLVNGKKLDRCKIVNAYDPTIAPIKKGKSNCPTQFGKKPGIIAEMATGFTFGFHLPEGNPDDASYVMPLVQRVDATLALLERKHPKRKPRIQSLAGDLGLDDPNVRAGLHQKGITTVGIPHSVEPIPKVPISQMIKEVQHIPGLEQQSTTQIEIAYACGYSRPFVEGLITTLICRGATPIKYKGHRGATLQFGMAIVAGNAATLARIKQDQLTKRAQKFRRFFRLKTPKPIENNIPNG